MLKKYKASSSWEKHLITNNIPYPDTFLIRIFKGKYPKLKFNYNKNDKILDVGYGEGRHFNLYDQVGLKIYGAEISQKIVNHTLKFFKNFFLKPIDCKLGYNHDLNFKSNFFDILVSWNACYYMSMTPEHNFNLNLKEFARVLKKNKYLVISIPKKTCFIYKNSKKYKDGYRVIKDDYFKMRNGEIMKIFKNEKEIKKTFSVYFKNFNFSDIQDNCFGLNYHWHVFVAQKK
jgi:ubiquinone/menaquinone biosynthesis C-methylase UbiE